MGSYEREAVSVAEIGLLLDGKGHARVAGSVSWRLRSDRLVHQGQADVRTALVNCEAGYVQMRYSEQRPWAPTMAYVLNKVPVRRVCVNAKHSGLPLGTHGHTYQPKTGSESAEELIEFPIVPRAVSLDEEHLKGAFFEFLGYCRIDAPPDCWTSPPTRREAL